MKYIPLDIPTTFYLPDWISAVAALAGVFFGGITLYKLLSRDEDKQQQINALKTIATTQTDINENLEKQILQLTNQTVEFKDQTKLMYELNRIILGYSLREEEKAKLDRIERLLKIRPWFKPLQNTSPWGGHWEIQFENTKEKAHEFSIEVVSAQDTTFQFLKYNNYETSQRAHISVDTLYGKYNENLSNLNFEIKLFYKDLNENIYYQTVTKDSIISIGEPILIEQ